MQIAYEISKRQRVMMSSDSLHETIDGARGSNKRIELQKIKGRCKAKIVILQNMSRA